MKKNRYFLYFLILVAGLKLALVAGNEIVAIPFDSESYIRQTANHLYELGAPPGYPIWLAFSGLSGVPQRISVEVLLIFSSFVLSFWLKKMFGSVCGALAFLMLVMSPATYFLFDYALSDGFYACLSILAIAFSGIVVFSEFRKIKLIAALMLGVTMGWMALSRNEDPLLFAWIGLILFLLVLRSSKTSLKTTRGLVFGNAVLVGATIIIPAWAMVEVVNLVHLNKSGVFARTLAGLPGHTRLLRNLAEIDTGEVGIHYVPVSAKARVMAYEESPTLKKYMAAVEDRHSIFYQVSREAGLPEGQIGAGWIWHVFNLAVLQANGVAGAEVEYRKINNELEDGFNSSRLKKRFILHSFATAPVLSIFSRLPGSAWEVAKKSFQTYPQGNDVGHEKQLFDAVALRREALTGGGYRHTIQGWAFVENSTNKVKSVMFVGGLEQSPSTVSYMPRSDVESGFKKPDGQKPSVIGFKLDLYSSSKMPGKLLYLLEDGATVMAADMSAGVKKFESRIVEGVNLYQGIDFAKIEPVVRVGYRSRIQAYISSIANLPIVSEILTFTLCALCVIPFVFGKHFPERRSRAQTCVFMLAALFLLRALFYAVLDSEAWAVEVRYMLAANFMAVTVMAIAVALCIDVIKKTIFGAPVLSHAPQ